MTIEIAGQKIKNALDSLRDLNIRYFSVATSVATVLLPENEEIKLQEEMGNGTILTVTVIRKVITQENSLDGWVTSTERKTIDYFSANIRNRAAKVNSSISSRSDLQVLSSGDPMIKKGAYAKLGGSNRYLTKENAEQLIKMISNADSMVKGAGEFHALKAEEDIKEEEKQKQAAINLEHARQDRATKAANGFCQKCHSYCHGDCEA